MAKMGMISLPPAATVSDDHFLQLRLDRAVVLVVAVAVGRLHHDVVGLGEDRRVADDRLVPLSQVAGEDDSPRLAVVAHPQLDHRRAEDMAGVVEDGLDVIVDPHGLVVRHGLQQRQRAVHVAHRVERLHGLPAPASFLAMPFLLEGGVFRLNLGGVAEHQLDQVGRGGGGDDRAAKTLLHQLRRQSAVVHVGVRQQQGVEIAEPQRALVPIAGQVRPLLIHPAVDQQPGAVGLDVVLRAGHLPRGPQKLQLHGAVLMVHVPSPFGRGLG